MSQPPTYDRGHAKIKPIPNRVSFATEMLAAAQIAYKNALTAQLTQIGSRRWQSHEIDKMRAEVTHWQAMVDREEARAAGQSHHGGPLRLNL